jgi:glutaredoxin
MKAVVWSKPACPYCDQAKALLKMKGIEYEEKIIGDGYLKEDLLEAVPGARSVPQIILDKQLIGGFQELKQYFAKV